MSSFFKSDIKMVKARVVKSAIIAGVLMAIIIGMIISQGNQASEKGDVIFVDTPDGGIEEGEEWVEPTEVGRNENVGFDVTDIVLVLSAVFVAVTVVLNFRKAK